MSVRQKAQVDRLDLFELHPQPMWIYDVATLQFLAVNEAAVLAYGWTRDEFARMTLRDIRPESELEPFERAVTGRAPGHSGRRRWRHLTRAGDEIHVEISASDVEWSGSRARLVTALNVTDRVEAEIEAERLLFELKTERSQLARLAAERAAVLEQLGEGVVVTDEAGTIRFLNSTLRQLHGITSPMTTLREFVDTYALFRSDGTPYPEEERPLLRALRRDEIIPREDVMLKRADGTCLILEVRAAPVRLSDGTRVGAVAVARDVTAARDVERSLRENEERLRLMVEGSEQVFFYIHDTAGIFEYVSPSVEAVLGYGAGDLVGRHYDILTAAAETSAEVRQRTDEALRTGSTQPAYVAFNRHRDGRTIIMEITETPILHEGRVTGMQGFARDITERRELETQLLQAQKMEAVGRLAGGIAHDFNNIMTAIRGHAELLLDEAENTSADNDVLAICRGAERASSLTRQLLAFSRKQVLRPRPLDLGRVVDGLGSMLGRLIGDHIVLRTAIADDLWPVRADPTQIEQVVLNLVMNAHDAMRQGGEVVITLANVTVPESGGGVGLAAGDYVELTVADTGHGIEARHLPHVFEPFFTTRPDGEGTGLGLATVYGITKQSDGHIFVDTEPGRGTSFRVLLQRVHEEPVPVEAARPGSLTGRGEETILLVEDESSVRDLVARVLRRSGYTIVEAADGKAGLEQFRERADEIDLLVTDIVMPGMSGNDLAAHLLEQRPDLRVLFMSGYAESMIEQYRERGAAGNFIQKPFTPVELVRAVRAALVR